LVCGKNNIMLRSDEPKVAGLFAGIGGIEKGLHDVGFQTVMLCEIDPAAEPVLKQRFDKDIRFVRDVRDIKALPKVDLICAGFPCQDLSQAGKTAGISGKQSSLIGEVFSRLANKRSSPRWLLLENVPFMLQLKRGQAPCATLSMLSKSSASDGHIAW
jgi:DNA (cytosine-5)-methyltransferase 1